MNQLAHNLREAALTLTYQSLILTREGLRWMARPIGFGVRALVLREDRILLVRHRSGATPWSLPGGAVGHAEDLATAALREVREEGGCTAQITHLLGLYFNYSNHFSNHIGVFVCTTQDVAHPPVGDLEIIDARFFLPQDIPATTDPGSRRRIAEFHQGLAGLSRSW
ncbi:NUDIX domain-containing protein [Candidatus Oscillochloris fontis]|uniref:NUDIX domain-containing protein n=1 Tax=Candidatus Oscillochloris fontis TaxID=2496868 RepID=UPI00101CAF90|nr:NUDIX domain-containing protein [Candidatus Oscillochloris fontis]